MSTGSTTQRLAAILAADVAGYSRLMSADEHATVATLNACRAVFRAKIEGNQGRVVDMAGDSVLAIFPTAIGAARAALDIQHAVADVNASLSAARRMLYRIGVNLGDIIEQDDGTVYGDGVNIAARVQSLAEPGGIAVSGTVQDQIADKLPGVSFRFGGEQSVKNIAKPVPVHHVVANGLAEPEAPSPTVSTPSGPARRRKWPVAVALGVVLAGIIGYLVWRLGHHETPQASAKAPVIAVLPFANMSDDPKQEYFSDGLTENVIDSLAHVRDVQVIARNSSFHYKGHAADVRKIGQELGAAYVVEGSVRRSADTVRVTAQLIDASSGAHLWSKSYDRELNAQNVFAIQDEIAQGIVATAGFSGVVRQQELALVKRKPPNELSSYECVLLGMQYLRVLSLKNFRQARDCLEPAVKLEPDYASLWRYLAYVYSSEYQQGFDPRPNSLDRALEAAQRAAQLAPGDVDIEAQLAIIHFFRGELDEFKSLAHRLAKLPPNGSVSVGGVGLFLCYADEWGTGLAMIEHAKALDPYFPGWYLNGEFHDHLRKGEFQAALESAQRVNLPDFPQALSQLIAAYGALNRPQDAKPYVERIRKLDPAFESHVRDHWTARFRYQPQYLETLLDAMRKGGLDVPPKKIP